MTDFTREKFRAAMAEHLGLPEDERAQLDDGALIEDSVADSLDAVELVMLAEDNYGVTIEDEEEREITTYGGLIDLVEAKVKELAGEEA